MLQLGKIKADLTRFGEVVASELPPIAAVAEANPPRLDRFDAWGQRIDHINTSWAWQYMHRVAAREGLIATAYEMAGGKSR